MQKPRVRSVRSFIGVLKTPKQPLTTPLFCRFVLVFSGSSGSGIICSLLLSPRWSWCIPYSCLLVRFPWEWYVFVDVIRTLLDMVCVFCGSCFQSLFVLMIFCLLNAVWLVKIAMDVWCQDVHPQIKPLMLLLDMTRPATSFCLVCKHWYVYDQVLLAVISSVNYRAFYFGAPLHSRSSQFTQECW